MRTLGAVLCAVVLLAASTVQAAHFCELSGGATTVQRGRAEAPGSAPEFCLICATAHQASMRAPTAGELLPSPSVVARTAIRSEQSRSQLQVFTMDVRPPPAA